MHRGTMLVLAISFRKASKTIIRREKGSRAILLGSYVGSKRWVCVLW